MSSTYQIYVHSIHMNGRWSESEDWELIGTFDQKMEIYDEGGNMIDELDLMTGPDELEDETDAEQIFKSELTYMVELELEQPPRCNRFTPTHGGLEDNELGVSYDMEVVPV